MKNALAMELLQSLDQPVSLHLWQLGAVKVNLKRPFKLASGNYSPIYINCRLLISSPSFMDMLSCAARVIVETSRIRFNAIAGGETAGIPFAAVLARSFGCSMVYVRKEAKAYGLKSRIEGVLPPHPDVLLVEDLITDAGSKLSFIEALRSTRAIVRHVLVIFDRLQGGKASLASKGVALHAMTNINTVLQVAEDRKLLDQRTLSSVRLYLRSPAAWHTRLGLSFKH